MKRTLLVLLVLAIPLVCAALVWLVMWLTVDTNLRLANPWLLQNNSAIWDPWPK